MRLRDYFRSKGQLMEQLSDAQRDAEVNALCFQTEQKEKENLLDDLLTAEHCLETEQKEAEALRQENNTLRALIWKLQPRLQTAAPEK